MKNFFLVFLLILLQTQLFPQDNEGLIKAVKDGNSQEVSSLIDSGADINYIGRFKWTPLMWAVRNNYKDIVKLLLDRGALVDLDGTSKNAVTIAKENGFDEILELLFSENVIYSNIEEEKSDITDEELIRTPEFILENQKGILNYRLFAKLEDGEPFFAVKFRYLNQHQEDIGGIAFTQGKRLDTFSKKMSKVFYNNEYYFADYFTIIIDVEDFIELVNLDQDIDFGIRRAKYDFDFTIPKGVLKSIYKKSLELNLLDTANPSETNNETSDDEANVELSSDETNNENTQEEPEEQSDIVQ